MRDLGRLQRGRGIPLDPAGLHTEAEERAEILQPLRRGQRGVLPPPAKLAEPFDRQVAQLPVAPVGAEREQLAFQELPPFLDRGRGQIPNGRLLEELLDGRGRPSGSSGLRTPMRPDDCHWWTMEEAAVQLLVFRLRRMVSPPIEPWTQMGHWHRVQRLPLSTCLQLAEVAAVEREAALRHGASVARRRR